MGYITEETHKILKNRLNVEFTSDIQPIQIVSKIEDVKTMNLLKYNQMDSSLQEYTYPFEFKVCGIVPLEEQEEIKNRYGTYRCFIKIKH